MPFCRVDLNEGRDVKAEKASSSSLGWNVVQIQPQDLLSPTAGPLQRLPKARAVAEGPASSPHPASLGAPLALWQQATVCSGSWDAHNAAFLGNVSHWEEGQALSGRSHHPCL